METHVFHRQNILGDSSGKDCANYFVCLYLLTLQRIEAYVTTCIYKLANMDLMVLVSNKAYQMRPERHLKLEIADIAILQLRLSEEVYVRSLSILLSLFVQGSHVLQVEAGPIAWQYQCSLTVTTLRVPHSTGGQPEHRPTSRYGTPFIVLRQQYRKLRGWGVLLRHTFGFLKAHFTVPVAIQFRNARLTDSALRLRQFHRSLPAAQQSARAIS